MDNFYRILTLLITKSLLDAVKFNSENIKSCLSSLVCSSPYTAPKSILISQRTFIVHLLLQKPLNHSNPQPYFQSNCLICVAPIGPHLPFMFIINNELYQTLSNLLVFFAFAHYIFLMPGTPFSYFKKTSILLSKPSSDITSSSYSLLKPLHIFSLLHHTLGRPKSHSY